MDSVADIGTDIGDSLSISDFGVSSCEGPLQQRVLQSCVESPSFSEGYSCSDSKRYRDGIR